MAEMTEDQREYLDQVQTDAREEAYEKVLDWLIAWRDNASKYFEWSDDSDAMHESEVLDTVISYIENGEHTSEEKVAYWPESEDEA